VNITHLFKRAHPLLYSMVLSLDAYDYDSDDIEIDDLIEATNVEISERQKSWHFVKDPKKLVPNNNSLKRIAIKLATGTATLLKSFLLDSVIVLVRPELAAAKGLRGIAKDAKGIADDIHHALSKVDLSEKAIDNLVVYFYLSHYYFYSFFRGVSPTASIVGQALTDDDNDCYLNVLDELENNYKNSTFYSNHVLFSFGRLIKDFKKKDMIDKLELFEQNAIQTIRTLLQQYNQGSAPVIDRLEKMDMI